MPGDVSVTCAQEYLLLRALSHMGNASVAVSLMLRRERVQVTRRSVANSVGT
jgi:hypothetical protein